MLDIRMPGLDGVQATRSIAAARSSDEPRPAVLILTTFDEDGALFGALSAGASGFLLKDAAPQELATAIRTVASGAGYLDVKVTRRVIEQFGGRPLGTVRDDPRLGRLTPRERDVLGLIARGMSNAEIAVELFLSEGTVKTHVRHLLDKLEVRDRAQAAVFAYQAGMGPNG